MRKILKVTSIIGVATVVRIFAGLARAKFLAWQLGPAGVGLVGQAMMYSSFAVQLCSLNIGIGITKEVAESLSQKKEENVRLIANVAMTLQFVASLLLITAVLPFSRGLTSFVFSEAKYWIYFVMITLATPFAVALTGIADPIFYGLKKISEYTKLVILYTLIGLGLLFVLVYFYKTEGMFIQIAVLSVVGFFLAFYFLGKKAAVRPRLDAGLFRDGKLRAVTKSLFQYGIMSFIPANIGMFVMLYLRGLFMKQYGVEANGYFQVAYALSAYYIPFVTNGVWGHFYPEMCSLKEDRDINRELNQFIRFAVLISTAIAAGILLFRKYIILTLYSSRFLQASDLVAVQAIGDIFFMLYYIFATSLMARRKFKDAVIFSMLAYNGMLLLSYYLLTRFAAAGLLSMNIAIAFSNGILAVIAMVYWRFDTGFALSRLNAGLFVKSAAFIAILSLVPDRNIFVTAAKIGVAALWFIVSVTRAEFTGVIQTFASKLKKKAVNGNGA
jgi:O-antigen/teichoic acid export membrane protein